MAWTLSDARQLSPKSLRNEIVQKIDQAARADAVTATDAFPLVELSNPSETFFRMDGLRMGMTPTDFGAESPIGDMEVPTEDEVDVETYKRKISPEKGVDTELNEPEQILNLFDAAAEYLATDIMVTRERLAWQGDEAIEGLIGQDGATAHSDLDASHVIAGSDYSATGSSTPQDDFTEAQYEITDDGNMLGQASPITAYVSPSVIRDLKQNDDLESRFSGVAIQGLTQDQVANVLPIENLEVVTQKIVRRNANGEPIDDAGNVVSDPSDAARDNVLEPWDPGASTNRRNVVVGAFGEVSGFIPWFADRLGEHAEDAPPSGDFAIDTSMGFLTQRWTEHDPLVSWFKAAQEVGFHLHRPENFAIIQDV